MSQGRIRVLLTVLFFIGIIFSLFPNSYAASTKEEYELQERCSKRTEDLFKKEYGNYIVSNEAGTTTSNYTNHYNRKLNKCFILVTQTHIPKDKETREKLGVSIEKTLVDINENKLYGHFFKFSNGGLTVCKVLGKHCSSDNEWNALVMPYMEE